MDDTHLEMIYQALRDYTTNITIIDFTENNIGDAGVHCIVDLLRINKVIYSLVLTHSLFTI